MSFYTFILDLAVNNVYALFCWIRDNQHIRPKLYNLDMSEFKRRIATALTQDLRLNSKSSKNRRSYKFCRNT